MAQSTLCVCQDIPGPQTCHGALESLGSSEGSCQGRGPWVAQLVGWARGSLPSKNGREAPSRENSHLGKGSNPIQISCAAGNEMQTYFPWDTVISSGKQTESRWLSSVMECSRPGK